MHKSPFLLLSTIRSGTTFFCTVMNSHPQVAIYDETMFYDYDFSLDRTDNFYTQWYQRVQEDPSQITHRNMTAFAYSFIRERLAPREDGKIVGLDLKYAFWDRLQFVRDYFLNSNPRPKVIHLVRNNTLRAHLSAFLLNCRNKGITAGKLDIGEYNALEKIAERRVRVSPTKEFLAVLQLLESRKAHFRAVAAEYFNSIEITYEELAGPERDDPSTFADAPRQRICEFLGIDPALPMRTDMTKVNPYSLRELIENYDELATVLTTLGLDWYLD